MSLIYFLSQIGEYKIKLSLNEQMKDHTTFKVGGTASVMLFPETPKQLRQCVEVCRGNSMRYIILGNGSNILFNDKGTGRVVIKTKNVSGITVSGETITAGCGALLSKLSSVALEHSLTGLEFASGIPASLGGAVYMNAGAYGGEMSQVVIKTTYLDDNGKVCEVSGEEHEFSYRHSAFSGKSYCILQSTLQLAKGNPEEIRAKMDDLNKRRREKQPIDCPSAGSSFKRPCTGYAAALIEECGLKGTKIGGAEVSTKHSGFIINTGFATAEDILALMKLIKATVLEKKGIELESEIVYIPD